MTQIYKIQRYADFETRVTIDIDGTLIDSSLYTFVAKIRDMPVTTQGPAGDFIPGGVITVTTAVVGGDLTALDLLLTDTQTATLSSTEDAAAARRPRLDIKMTRTSDGKIFITDYGQVTIFETYSYA